MKLRNSPPRPGDPESREPVEPGPSPGEPTLPWSPGMTLLLGLLLFGGYLVLQALVTSLALLPALIGDIGQGRPPDPIALMRERVGLLFTIGTAVAAPLATGSALALSWWGLLRQGVVEPRRALRRSLGLRPPRLPQVALWTILTVLFLAAYEILAQRLDRPPLPDFMVDFHASAGWLPGLLFVVVFVAPLVEEVLFRGFMLPGIAAGPGGAPGAIAVTALLFALVHTQYDLFDMSAVLGLGILLGAARWFSGSLWLAYALHAAINGFAAAQLVWALGW